MKWLPLLLLLLAPLAADAQTPSGVANHAVPLGKGSGAIGWGAAAPGGTGTVLTSNGANADPTFQAGAGGSGITINTTPILGGTGSRFLFDNGGTVGESGGFTWSSSNQTLTLSATATSTLSALTINGQTGVMTLNAPVLDLTQTWNNAGVTFSAIRLNVTNTASNAASKLVDLQVAASSKFSVDASGNVLGGTYNKVALTAPATGSTLTIADGKTATFSNSLTFNGVDGKTLTVNATGTLAGGDAWTMSITANKTVTHTASTTFAGVDGKTLTTNNSLTLAGTDGKSLTLTNGLTITGNDGTINFGAASKTLGVNNSITLAGTDSTTMTFPSVTATIPRVVATGAKALATSAISSGTCTTAQTATATGTLTTDAVGVAFSADPTATTGYAASTSGMLTIMHYPTADTVNFKVCNNTGASITPGAVTVNWLVTR